VAGPPTWMIGTLTTASALSKYRCRYGAAEEPTLVVDDRPALSYGSGSCVVAERVHWTRAFGNARPAFPREADAPSRYGSGP